MRNHSGIRLGDNGAVNAVSGSATGQCATLAVR